jgi:hypothetical protein
MATQKGSGLISRAVREALSTLVSPQLCEQLISRSLASQGLTAVPESGAVIGEWLEGALRGEVETTVGPDAADLMMMQLGPIAAYAAISQPSMPAAAPILAGPANANGVVDSSAPSIPAARRDLDMDDERPTDLRFDLSAEPVWAPASGPPDQSKRRSDPFSSDPPTGVFAAPREDGSPIASFLSSSGKDSSDPAVRTLPPAKPVSDRPAAPAPGRQPLADSTSKNRVANRTARPSPLDEVANDTAKALPLVLTATNNKDALGALRRYLTSAASVVHVPDLVGLLDALEEPDVVEPVVLIDCHNPTVHISSVAAIGEDLPRGTTVVLWGVDDATWLQLDRERAPACRWVRCSSEATTDDVGSLCSMLLG